MSQKTVLSPEGPVGPGSETPQERSQLLSDSHDVCDNPRDSSPPEEEVAGGPGESQSEGRGSARGGNSSNSHLVRTQPQRLPHPTASVEPGGGDGGAGQSQNGRRAALSNGAAPEPRRQSSSTVSHKVQRKLQSSLSVHSDGSRRSKGSSGSSHKPGSSPEDCCVHCILACLFCEFLALCNMAVSQASCGACSPEACCCCCGEELGDDCSCPCDLDCGVMDACCESSDCLEICMECCGICFPT
ncbi:myoD family inhibitor domain-containing protein isoform X2 [Conger conger]|nr:myoD family inhibitor domain-containing protein isoform X2 [Conger conger]XP_061109184.1 myoD family inhibitor domain-containing protein isoform X2 [Conger conger]